MSNKTILFADDSATMRQIVEKTFAAEPFKVVGVPSGEGAVAKAKELKPDVIIVDAGMPGVSGYDVCSAVRSDPAIRHTPVVIMSGVSSLYDEARGKSVGVTEHVKKPFDTGLLIDLIGSVVAAAAPPIQNVALEDVEPEDLPLEPISEPPLPEPEFPALSEPPIPLTAGSIRPSAQAISDVDVSFVRKPVGKQTQEYARPSSPPIDVHVGASLTADDEETFGDEVDFGDDAEDFSEPETTSDVPPIEIDTKPVDDDSHSFHVGTLAELAQMDSKGAPLDAIPHENAIELKTAASSASSLASLGPKMSREPIREPLMEPDTLDTVSEIPDADADEAIFAASPSVVSMTPIVPAVSVPSPDPVRVPIGMIRPMESAKPSGISAGVALRADAAAEQLAGKIEGITPAQAAAIQTLTREIIERVVWEVVPDLAEVIIKEELSKLLEE